MHLVVRTTTDGVRWHTLADWEPILLGPDGLRLAYWRAEGCLEATKDANHRGVYRVAASGRAFFVKHYRCPRFWDVARHLVRASSARREWHNLAEASRRGLPTVRPVAWGERLRGGLVWDNYLVTEAIPASCTLQQYMRQRLPLLPEPERSATRRKLLDALAHLAAAMHRAGVWHDDFHDGNVMVSLDSLSRRAGDGPRLYLIDLSGARLGGTVAWRASRQNLAVLSSIWSAGTPMAQQWRFWCVYRKGRPDLRLADPRAEARLIVELGRRHSEAVVRRRDKRCLRTNRDFRALRGTGAKAHAVAAVAADSLRQFLNDPDALLQRNLDRPIKLGHGSLVVQAEIPMDDGPRRVALKRYRPRNLWRALKGLFRASRARRGWWAGHVLLARQIRTPRPLAVWEPRGPGLAQWSYLATEWLSGAENLHLWGWRVADAPVAERLREASAIARDLGRQIGRMHAHQIAHRDLKGSNILLVRTPCGLETYLADVDGIRIARRLGARARVADLSRLAVSISAHRWVTAAIGCRFLKEYTAQFPTGAVSWKRLWREIAGQSARRIDRKTRRREEVL